MTDINNVVIVGRLTRDSELKYGGSGVAVLKFSIATNKSVKKDDTWKDETSFFNCVLFGKRGEALAQYLLKGKQLVILGSLNQNTWESEGKKHSAVNIVANSVQFMGDKQAKPVAPKDEPFEDDIPF